jgi:fatty acid desaturase
MLTSRFQTLVKHLKTPDKRLFYLSMFVLELQLGLIFFMSHTTFEVTRFLHVLIWVQTAVVQYVILHDYAHENVLSSPESNANFGKLCGITILLPMFDVFQHVHIREHQQERKLSFQECSNMTFTSSSGYYYVFQLVFNVLVYEFFYLSFINIVLGNTIAWLLVCQNHPFCRATNPLQRTHLRVPDVPITKIRLMHFMVSQGRT